MNGWGYSYSSPLGSLGYEDDWLLEEGGAFSFETVSGALQSDFGLAASADNCITPGPPPPPPIDWHTQKPRPCTASSDHCSSTSQNGTKNGPATGPTRAAHAGSNASAKTNTFTAPVIDPTTGLPIGTKDPEDSCLSGSPTAPNLIDYWATDPAAGNRATGADACLTSKASGTAAQTNIAGYKWAQSYVKTDLNISASRNINACHLIPQQAGGRGVRANLATCGRGTNYPQSGSSISPMYYAEQKVIEALGIPGGQVVYYRVIPLYEGARTVPTGFMIYGVGSVSGVIVDETVGNVVYDSRGNPHNLGTATASDGSVPLN